MHVCVSIISVLFLKRAWYSWCPDACVCQHNLGAVLKEGLVLMVPGRGGCNVSKNEGNQITCALHHET
jgi:hypothetical protein